MSKPEGNKVISPRVIIIRENPETLTCSNCAGTLEGIDAFGISAVPDYAPVRAIMNRAGELYLALRKRFGDKIQIDMVDPRNEVYLIPVLLGDYRRYHPPLTTFLKTLLFGISPASVIVNGRAIHTGDLPSPEVLVEEVGQLLRAQNLLQHES